MLAMSAGADHGVATTGVPAAAAVALGAVAAVATPAARRWEGRWRAGGQHLLAVVALLFATDLVVDGVLDV